MTSANWNTKTFKMDQEIQLVDPFFFFLIKFDLTGPFFFCCCRVAQYIDDEFGLLRVLSIFQIV